MTKFYVDSDGNYLGGFDGAEPPAGAIEVADAPQDARQTWDGTWSPVPPPDPIPVSAEDIWRVLEDKGLVKPVDLPPDRRPPPR